MDAADLEGDPLPWLLPIPSPLAALPHNYHSPALRCLASSSSSSPSSTETKEGRGLFATRAIKEGELLFVSNPVVAADVAACFRLFKANEESLQTIVETELVRGLRVLLEEKRTRKATQRLLRQMADGRKTDLPPPRDLGEMDKRGEELGAAEEEEEEEEESMDDAALLALVRTNAYGPEFKRYHSI